MNELEQQLLRGTVIKAKAVMMEVLGLLENFHGLGRGSNKMMGSGTVKISRKPKSRSEVVFAIKDMTLFQANVGYQNSV